MATLLILGAGMMGTALAIPLFDRGHDVRLVGTHLDDEVIASLKQASVHPKLKLEIPSGIRSFFAHELAEAAKGVELWALGVSSAGIQWATEQLAPYVRRDTPLFMITKGLVLDQHKLGAVPAGGPSGGRTNAPAPERAASPFPTTDVVGAEVSAALKNAYAMGIGFAAGLHEKAGGKAGSVAMHNLESATMAQAVLEMRRIVARLGGDPDTVSGLAGVGDLDVTTNGGRTGRFGRLPRLGLSRDEAIAAMEGATLECLEILAVMDAAWRGGALGGVDERELPLLRHLTDVALRGAPVDLPLDRFFAG